MVNNQSPYLAIFPHIPPPPAVSDPDTRDRKIQEHALWDLEEMLAIVVRDSAQQQTIRMVTFKAERDYENLVENEFCLQNVLCCIKADGRFKGAWWCKTSPSVGRDGKPRGTGFWLPCDSYCVRMEYEHPVTKYRGDAEYYLKMCKAHDGTAILFVSLHL